MIFFEDSDRIFENENALGVKRVGRPNPYDKILQPLHGLLYCLKVKSNPEKIKATWK